MAATGGKGYVGAILGSSFNVGVRNVDPVDFEVRKKPWQQQ
jgi:hypothetical protein